MTFPASRRRIAAGKPVAIALLAHFALPVAFPATSLFSAFAQEKSLEPVVVTASRSPQIAMEILSDNTVITAEDIARSGQTTLADVLQEQRGIQITRNGGPGTQTGVYVRGTDNRQNIVLVDGVRVGSSTSGGASWNAIPLSQIDRVEIVYGPLSTMYGADAVGGVIQIFTKQGDGAPAVKASAGAGSYSTWNTEAGVAGSEGGFRYSFNAAHETSDSFSATRLGNFGYNPDRDGYTSNSASGNLGFTLAKGHEIGATFLHSRLDSQYDGSATYDDRSRTTLASYSVFAKNRILTNWHSHFQLAQSRDDNTSDSAFGSPFFKTTQKYVSWQNNINVRETDVLQLVLEQRKEEVDSSTLQLAGTRTTNSVAAAYQLRSGPHLAAVSVRNDDSSQFGSHATGSAAYGYRITKTLRGNISYGTSFRAPTFNELYYPLYGVPSNRPEEGKNVEIGLHYEDGKSQYNAVYYNNRLTDLLVSLPVCPVTPAAYPFGCGYNVNKAEIRGLSLGARTQFDNVTVHGTLDLQDPQDETTNRRLVRRAKVYGTLGLDYAVGKVGTGGEVVFSGARFDDANNRNRLGGYGVLNLYANYEFARNWTMFGRWNNVFDKNYELARTYNTAGSNVFVGVRYGMR